MAKPVVGVLTCGSDFPRGRDDRAMGTEDSQMAVWSTQFEHALRLHSKFISNNTTIDPDVSLLKLGIDSLEIAELIALIEDEFRLEIPLERLTPESFATPRTIWQLLCSIEPSLQEAELAE